MDLPKESAIDQKIASISYIIKRELFYQLPRDIAEEHNQIHKQENRINFFKKILFDLKLQRTEFEWVVVPTQDQNENDEVWKYKDPGPDFTSADKLSGSNILGNLLSPYLMKGFFSLGTQNG